MVSRIPGGRVCDHGMATRKELLTCYIAQTFHMFNYNNWTPSVHYYTYIGSSYIHIGGYRDMDCFICTHALSYSSIYVNVLSLMLVAWTVDQSECQYKL